MRAFGKHPDNVYTTCTYTDPRLDSVYASVLILLRTTTGQNRDYSMYRHHNTPPLKGRRSGCRRWCFWGAHIVVGTHTRYHHQLCWCVGARARARQHLRNLVYYTGPEAASVVCAHVLGIDQALGMCTPAPPPVARAHVLVLAHTYTRQGTHTHMGAYIVKQTRAQKLSMSSYFVCVWAHLCTYT